MIGERPAASLAVGDMIRWTNRDQHWWGAVERIEEATDRQPWRALAVGNASIWLLEGQLKRLIPAGRNTWELGELWP